MSVPPILTTTVPESISNPNADTCNVSAADNTLLNIFNQLITDSNSILGSRFQQQVNSNQWNFLSQEIGSLVADANRPRINAEERSLIYGQIMLIITAQYLPTVSNYLGDQIAEQAAIQNMSSDISAFIIQAESGFNTLSSTPDCSCPTTCSTDGDCPGCTETTDCLNNYNFYSGVMVMLATSGSSVAPDTGTTPSGTTFSYSFTASLDQGPNTQPIQSSEQNVLSFLTDPTIWDPSGGIPLSSSQSTQINTALLGIATVFNPSVETANVPPDTWSTMDLPTIASAICSWTQPYGSSDQTDFIATGNAPLVWTQPATVQADLNTAAQTIEGVATSTQTIENFQVQEIDQFYGITNSIQMSQEQQGAAMVKQQTT
jgi:hypothetical protein